MSIRRILASAAVFVTIAAAGHAQSIADQAVRQLTAQGYSRIEVKRLGTTVKIEAQRNGRELEVVYDAATGAILKQDVNRIRPSDDTTPGIYVSGRGHDSRSDRSQGRGGRLGDDTLSGSDDNGVGHDVGDDHSNHHDGKDHGGRRNDDDHGENHDRRGSHVADHKGDDDHDGRGRSSDDD